MFFHPYLCDARRISARRMDDYYDQNRSLLHGRLFIFSSGEKAGK
jgi:hypothetical protein